MMPFTAAKLGAVQGRAIMAAAGTGSTADSVDAVFRPVLGPVSGGCFRISGIFDRWSKNRRQSGFSSLLTVIIASVIKYELASCRNHKRDRTIASLNANFQSPEFREEAGPRPVRIARADDYSISDHETLKDINAVILYEDWEEGLTKILRAMKLDDPDHRRTLHLIDLIRYH